MVLVTRSIGCIMMVVLSYHNIKSAPASQEHGCLSAQLALLPVLPCTLSYRCETLRHGVLRSSRRLSTSASRSINQSSLALSSSHTREHIRMHALSLSPHTQPLQSGSDHCRVNIYHSRSSSTVSSYRHNRDRPCHFATRVVVACGSQPVASHQQR